jgi:hypothetical protein
MTGLSLKLSLPNVERCNKPLPARLGRGFLVWPQKSPYHPRTGSEINPILHLPRISSISTWESRFLDTELLHVLARLTVESFNSISKSLHGHHRNLQSPFRSDFVAQTLEFER